MSGKLSQDFQDRLTRLAARVERARCAATDVSADRPFVGAPARALHVCLGSMLSIKALREAANGDSVC
jgi:hypothetical protein